MFATPSIRVVAMVLVAMMLLATPVAAAPRDDARSGGDVASAGSGLPTAVVSLGDSYISGEGGRWEGNAADSTTDRDGTDRAAYRWRWFWLYDAERVYGQTDDTGCHRSDVAPISWAGASVDVAVNLACSGAATDNVFRAASGGVSHRGEPPQVDQLAALTVTHDVEVVVLSIGGNDLGFAEAIIDCTIRYNTSATWWRNLCAGSQQTRVDAAMPGAMAGVAQAIADIHGAMVEAGDVDYRLILASYPSPIPRGAEFRYSEGGWSRTFIGGCPFWNSDATWARDQLVPQISGNLASVAAAGGAEFLDLSDALQGREVCSTNTTQGLGPRAEWARFLSTGITQGEAQESLHPGALGQRAIGTCLQLMISSPPGDRRCTNVAGAGPDVMSLS